MFPVPKFTYFWKARLFMCHFFSKCFVAIRRAITQRGRCRRWRSVPWNWKAPSIDGTNVGLVSEIAGTGFGSLEWGGSKGIVEVDSKLGGGFKAFLWKFYPYFLGEMESNLPCAYFSFMGWLKPPANEKLFGMKECFCRQLSSFDMTSLTLNFPDVYKLVVDLVAVVPATAEMQQTAAEDRLGRAMDMLWTCSNNGAGRPCCRLENSTHPFRHSLGPGGICLVGWSWLGRMTLILPTLATPSDVSHIKQTHGNFQFAALVTR